MGGPVKAADLFKDAQVLLDGLKLVKSIKKPLCFKIDGKVYHVDLNNHKSGEGAPEGKPEMTITVSEQDMNDLASGKLDPVQAFMQGKVKVQGNMGVLMKFQSLQPKLQKLASKY